MKLHFVELRVRDWTASMAWYRDVLGLEPVMTDPLRRFALLRSEGCQIALKEGEPTPGGVLLSFEVNSLGPFVGKIKTSEEGYRRVRLADPDGYDVVLFEWYDQSD